MIRILFLFSILLFSTYSLGQTFSSAGDCLMKTKMSAENCRKYDSKEDKLEPADGCLGKSIILQCPNPFENKELVNAKVDFNRIILDLVNNKGMDEIDALGNVKAIAAIRKVQNIRKQLLRDQKLQNTSSQKSPAKGAR